MDAASSVEYFVLLRRQLLEVLQLTPESDAVFGIIKDLKLGNTSFVRFGRLLLLAALPFLGGLHLFRLLSDELDGLLAGVARHQVADHSAPAGPAAVDCFYCSYLLPYFGI